MSQIWEDLNELSRNLWWSWDARSSRLFRQLAPAVWEASHHSPIAVLDTLAEDGTLRRVDELDLRHRVEDAMRRFRAYLASADPIGSRDLGVDRTQELSAYFCAEFGIHESLPIYAGGLGILAGDHLKSASDLGVPMVAIGLLYREGYFTQLIDGEGRQHAYYRRNDMDRMGLRLVDDEYGRFTQLELPIGDEPLLVCMWTTAVGRVPLILLDAGLWQNRAIDRQLTQRLYGGRGDTRIQQEILLGIGGVRALRFLGYDPSVWHMNEGHTAFLALELVREKVAAGAAFGEAVAQVRERCVFTTHTPVPAGHDRFPVDMVERNLGWLREELGVDQRTFLGLGRINPNDSNETFCMTVLGLKLSRCANGVSELHGQVSRRMWHGLWPDRAVEEVPIEHVTNGVHIPTWIAPEMAELLDSQLGLEWRERAWDPAIWSRVDDIPDSLLWAVHGLLKRRLVDFARQLVQHELTRAPHRSRSPLGGGDALDAEWLTIGFARRFATYKRGDLLFRDLDLARRVLADSERPIQILFAGKAHPQDFGGSEIIRRVVRASQDPVLRRHVIFLPDYGMNVAKYLVQGVDVWLNNPRRPREASGTSGQKGPLNGAINVSTVDGWWCEGYNGSNGWNIGDDRHIDSEWDLDQRDHDALCWLIENEIAPRYYQRDADGLPRRWIRWMKASMKSIAPAFNSDRMVREYAGRHYWPR